MEIAQPGLTTRVVLIAVAVLIAVGVLIATPAPAAVIGSTVLLDLIGSLLLEEMIVSPGGTVPIAAIALAAMIGPLVAAVFKRMVRLIETTVSVPTRVPSAPQVPGAAVVFRGMIVSPVATDSNVEIVRLVTVPAVIALEGQVPRALNASGVSGLMVAVGPAAAIGIGMSREAPSIRLPLRVRKLPMPLMRKPMTCSGGVTPLRQRLRLGVRFIASGAHQSCAAPPSSSSFSGR